jgi:hypothetical protein
MSEPKRYYFVQTVRQDPDGSVWLWIHGSRYRRLVPETHPALEPVKVEDWDAVEVVKRVRRIE